jgi:Ser/Thr protein kinase RdoA (MazF antagonist)
MTGFYELASEAQSECVAKLAREALASWGLEARALELLKYRENAVFRVSASDGNAARACIIAVVTATPSCTRAAWMRALLRTVSTCRARPHRRNLFVVANTRSRAASGGPVQWIAGPARRVEARSRGCRVAGKAWIIGVLAALLHNQAERWTPPAGFTRHAWDARARRRHPFGDFWELAALTGEQRSLIERARARVQSELSQLERSPRNYGLIHADFAPENLMVDGERIRLLDFDDAGYGWHLFEVVTSLYFHIGQPYFDAIERAMLEGYRSERRLSAEDEALLPLFYAARSFTYLGWVHTRQETETARELTPMLVDLCCGVATRYLGTGP